MIADLLRGLSHILAPRVCSVCHHTLGAYEDTLCLQCRLDMPRTHLHHIKFNIIHQRLGHECHVDRAAAWFYYRKDTPYAQILVKAKYSNLPNLCVELGRMYADELADDNFFEGIDIIVPMTMHWLKRLRRGYNQAHEICHGIADATGIPICNALRAVRSHGVQSRHNKQQRYAMIANSLAVSNPQTLAGKHILVVDDIITTGASMAEAVRTLQSQASPASISVLCLGLTQLA